MKPEYTDIYLDYREGEECPWAYKYPRPSVTADCLLFSKNENVLHVLLIRRGGEPFKGCWAFPGGFLETGMEDVEQCARRELLEETGLTAGELQLVGVYSKPGRDPRCPVVTASYCGFVEMTEPHGGDDAAEARWIPVDRVGELTFDHSEMLKKALSIINNAIK